MAVTSWTSPSTSGTGIAGDIAWSSASNAYADDGANASATIASSETSEYLQLQGFGFSIPSGATIDAVEVRIDRSSSGGGLPTLSDLQLMYGDFGDSGSLKGDPDSWVGTGFWSSSGFASFAGEGDSWSGYVASLTPAIVNHAQFGVALRAAGSGFTTTCNVDVVQLRVFYTEADESAEELDYLAPLKLPPLEEPRTEFDLLGQTPASNLDPIEAPEPDPAAGVDAASLALPPEFPIEEIAELAWLPVMPLDPMPDVEAVPGSYLGVAALALPPEFPVEDICELIPPPSILRPEDLASSTTGAASYLMVPDCPVLDPEGLLDNLGELAGMPVMNLSPLPDAAESFPGTAVVSRVGIGTAILVSLQSHLVGESGPYTAIVSRVGPGAAVVYRRSDP